MFFESNGVPRVVEVVDKKSYESDASKSARRPARDKADPLLPGSEAAPMAGEVIEVKVKPGGRLWPRCRSCVWALLCLMKTSLESSRADARKF